MFRKFVKALKNLWEKMVEADRLAWKERIAHGSPCYDCAEPLYC